MASARFAWGIDIGNRALKAIRLSRGDAGLRIDDFEVIEHENVLSNAGDNRDSLIQSALANFVQRHPFKGGVAAISVSGVSSFARFIKLPPVETKKIPEIVRFEAIQQIPFPLDDVEWSYQLFQAPDSPDVEVGIFAMRRELINSHIKYFTDVDLNVQYVQMNPLAVYNAMYYDGRLKGTTMIIDLGAENTDLIIADGETIWLRSIPIGGNNFTEVLVKSFKLPFAKAEELKRNASSSKYARQIFQAMRPVFADLVAEVQRSMGFYASVHRDSRIKKVIALGGTFRLPGLQKYLQQNLQLDVERMDTLAAGAPSDGKLATQFHENILSLVSAYGLAIQAMGEGKITSSLLPEHIRREKMWRDKTKWFGLAAAGFVMGTGLAVGGYYISQFEHNQAKPTRDHNLAILNQGRTLSQEWQTHVQDQTAPDRQRITNVRDMLAGRALWPGIISDIFGALPAIPDAITPGSTHDIKEVTSVPRNQRELVLVDSMTSQYTDNLAAAATALANGGAPPTPTGGPQGVPTGALAGPADPNIPAGSRGFVITLNLTTPHRDGFLYVLNNIVPKLAALNRDAMEKWNEANPQNKKNFYIARVFNPVNPVQLKDDPSRLQLMDASYTAGQMIMGKITTPGGGAAPPAPQQPLNPPPFQPRPGRPPVGGGFTPPGFPTGQTPSPVQPAPGNRTGAAGNPDAYIDRITNEDRRNDWEMKLQLIVVTDPAPKVAQP